MDDDQPATMAAEAAATQEVASATEIRAEAEVVGTAAAYSEEPETGEWADQPPARTPRGRFAVLLAGILAVTGGIAAAILLIGQPEAVAPAASSAVTASAVSGPTAPVDKAFIDTLREYNVPVPDWRYAVVDAKSMCTVFDEGNAAPGDYTVEQIRQTVRDGNPSWNKAQVLFYSAAILNTYCPKYWGPTDEQLAAMPPDDRYVALLQSRTGIHNVSDGWASAINAGHRVCAERARGLTKDQSASFIYNGSKRNDGWSRDTAAGVVDIAIEVYCPR